ncbi:unnamed protein product [Meloidogyne enterolobii]|uniref:Uncharacterized protein n=1 Tax=Meloidogyne enterolobii TaxID=390850 RepID=A0ACB0ZYQ8_MELEN
MLEYFYSGEIDKKTIEKYSEDLFSIAHKYEVKKLMEICENYMAANIDAENFNERCNYSEIYCLPKLEKVKPLFPPKFLLQYKLKQSNNLDNDILCADIISGRFIRLNF